MKLLFRKKLFRLSNNVRNNIGASLLPYEVWNEFSFTNVEWDYMQRWESTFLEKLARTFLGRLRCFGLFIFVHFYFMWHRNLFQKWKNEIFFHFSVWLLMHQKRSIPVSISISWVWRKSSMRYWPRTRTETRREIFVFLFFKEYAVFGFWWSNKITFSRIIYINTRHNEMRIIHQIDNINWHNLS